MEYNKVLYEKKEYNLNAVLNFDLLKEILYKLLISQENIENEIDKINKGNIKRDNDISKLEKIINDNLEKDDDSLGEENNPYFSQEEKEEEPEENEEYEENEIIPQNEEEKKEENEKEVKQEIKEIKPKKEIIKRDEIQFNADNKEDNNEKEKEKEEEIIEPNNENDVEEKEEKEAKEEKEEREEEDNIPEQNIEEVKEEQKENVIEDNNNDINTENINEPKQEEKHEEKVENKVENNNNIKTETQIKTETKKPQKKESKKPSKIHAAKKNKTSIEKDPINPIDQNQNNDDNINNNDTIQSNSNANINHIPPDLISKMAKQIKDNKKRIVELEKKFKKDLAIKTDTLKNDYKQMINKLNKDHQNKLNDIYEKIKEMMDLKEKLENQMEDCITKCSTIDVINMFKDSGDGTVDAAKVMVRALEEKVFKKIEYIDSRAKKDQNNNSELKNNINDFLKIISNMDKDIKNINDILDKNKEDVNNIKSDFEDHKNEVDDFIKNNSNLKKEFEKLKNREKNLKENINDINEKIKALLSNNNGDQGSNDMFNISTGKKSIDDEILQAIDKKISDLRKKMNDLENTLKLKMQYLDEIQNESKNFKAILDKKITRDDLKELYNLHLNDLDEINDLKDNISATFDDIRKLKEQQTNIFQKLENLNRNITLLQSIRQSGEIKPGIINFDKYVEEAKLNEIINPILSNLDKMNKEILSLDRNLSDLTSNTKTLAKNERVNKLEDDLNNKLSEMKVIFSKKYVEKAELARNIKQLELQIKSLEFENKKSDAESWIMAKQPVGCFNCASCEANIKNVNPPNEYLPWNKYPQQDKIYRMGKGFSHMLQMMTSEFVKSIGNAQRDSDNEHTPKNNVLNHNFVLDKNTFNKIDKNSLNNNERKQSASVLKINNKEQINDEMLKKIGNYNLYSSKGKGKMQLPRVLKFKKKLKLRNESGVPVSDDEMSRRNDTAVKEGSKDTTAPKIMKIMKKNKYIKTEENADFNDTNNSKF